MIWRSGNRNQVTSVCAGDLISVRLARAAGEPDDREQPNLDGQQPHLIYVPQFSGDGKPGFVGGQTAPVTASQKLEYRVDLVAFWCPYNGQIEIDGGGGRDPGDQVTYDVWYERCRCAPRPPDDPTFTLRRVDSALPVPRGAYAVTVPQTASITFQFGDPQTFSIDPGQRFVLGALAFGTFSPAVVVIDAIAFHLRF